MFAIFKGRHYTVLTDHTGQVLTKNVTMPNGESVEFIPLRPEFGINRKKTRHFARPSELILENDSRYTPPEVNTRGGINWGSLADELAMA